MYIFKVIKNIFSVMDERTKRQYIVLQIFFLFAAFFQVAGIASIGPFISIVSNQDIIHSNAILSFIYDFGNFSSNKQFIIAAAAGSLVMILLSNAIAGLTMWFTFRFSVVLGSRLQRSIYQKFLYRDYIFHKTENYNKLIATVAQQIPRFVYMLFQPFLIFSSQLFVALIILVGLIILDPVLAILAGLIIGGSYLATYIFLRKSLVRHGKAVSLRNTRIQSILSESFIGIKDVRLGSLENKYIEQFDSANVRGLRSQAYISLSGELPRFIIESISFGAILLLALILISTQSDIKNVVPILSIYALAGYKLLPTMQQIYKSISSLSGHGSVAGILKDEFQKVTQIDTSGEPGSAMPIKDVQLSNISFTYPNAAEPAVNKVSYQFEKGRIYSIAGHSGSGKSTLADILLGLLTPESGEVIVNGNPLTNDNLASFRKSLSYVAQKIFVLDDTVINNVAFGVPEEEVDLERVYKALELAEATDIIENLPQGIHTNLGQDGKLLSGGQQQRIGIARALYKQCDLLVLDEPTSALDIESEYKLLKTLATLKKDLLIIIISHRPASIKMSDYVILMDRGSITNSGPYTNLLSTDSTFKSMMDKSTVVEE